MRTLALVLLSCFAPPSLMASHLFGGEIRYMPLGGTSYEITVLLYTAASSPSDMNPVVLDLGDGVVDTIPRTGIEFYGSANTCSDLQRNAYTTTHTYPGAGSYLIQCSVQNRNGGILNIPNSISRSLCVEALLYIPADLSPNSSIVFQTPQTAWQNTWGTYSHDPLAMDSDGDSLHFELIAPLGLFCDPVLRYTLPMATDFIWTDPQTGNTIWEVPVYFGEYNLCIRGSEWRNGQLIGQVTRDMSVCFIPMAIGIEEEQSASLMNLFPTLTSDVVRIENTSDAMLGLQIINASGQVVLQRSLPQGRTEVDLSTHASGPYWFVSQAVNGQRDGRMVIKQ